MLAGTHGVSADTIPLRIIPERGKVSENDSEPTSSEGCNILHEYEAGSKLANEASKLRPEAAPLAGDANSLPCLANVLAGEASADCINGNSIGSQAVGAKLSHVIVAGNLRPMLSQHTPAERVDFAERHRAEPAGALQPKVEAADASEQRENPVHHPRLAIVARDVQQARPDRAAERAEGIARDFSHSRSAGS
jgi:hypothetical protein